MADRIPSSEITPEGLYVRRRELLKNAGLAVIGAGVFGGLLWSASAKRGVSAPPVSALPALPSGVTPRPVSMRQQSAEGVRVLPLAGEGAGGSVDGFSAATLPTLTIGATTLRNVEVLVLEALPSIGDAPLDAIVGLDLLRTAGRLSFTRQDSVRTLLTLGPSPAPRAPDATATMRAVGALWGIDATVRAPSAAAPVTPLFLVLDSGAPFTVLGSAAARAAALALTPSPGPAPRGLDGAPLVTWTVIGEKGWNMPIDLAAGIRRRLLEGVQRHRREHEGRRRQD